MRKRKSEDFDEDANENYNEHDDDDMPVSRRRRSGARAASKKLNGDVDDQMGAAQDVASDAGSITRSRQTRAAVERGADNTIMLKIQGLPTEVLEKILSLPPKPTRKMRGRTPNPKRSTPGPALTSSTTLYPVPALDDNGQKPYGGILSEADANTAETLPDQQDRIRFDTAKKKAEDEQKLRLKLMSDAPSNGRTKKDKESTRVGEASLIECIHFGEHEIDTWYAAPYPEEYSLNKVLWICEFCLKYMNSEYVCWRHKVSFNFPTCISTRTHR